MGEDLEGCDVGISDVAVANGGDEHVINGIDELLLESFVGGIILLV